ncbi:MAG TPA: hypothetical protein VNL15_04365 [Dehalococcoidia bacterium]|nr:hypothetical protein [Dehalococcoidia bacterium]
MGILSRFLRRVSPKTTQVSKQECNHEILVPHWNEAEDTGKEELVSYYTCQLCNQLFTRGEGQELKKEAERQRMEASARLGGRSSE